MLFLALIAVVAVIIGVADPVFVQQVAKDAWMVVASNGMVYYIAGAATVGAALRKFYKMMKG